MKRLAAVVAAIIVTFTLVGSAVAADTFAARLRGFEEVPIVSTPGQGIFVGTLNDAGTQIDYTLIYFNMQSTVTQAHIHLAQQGVNGGIVLFLCTNLTPPAGVPLPPACPAGTGPVPAVVTGTLTAANVIAQAAQGIAAGEFGEVVDAIKAIVGYANVHSEAFPSGEVRGQVTH
jgi:hypothetical protein